MASFPDRDMGSFSPDEILTFLSELSQGKKQATKRSRFSTLNAFFNLIRSSYDQDMGNPCESALLRKVFRPPRPNRWDFLEKETVDEIIFRMASVRNRLLVELMARGGMRVGEVLKLKVSDIDDRRLILRAPKSGRDEEVVFIPTKIAQRLREFIRDRDIKAAERVFPIGYGAARRIVKKAGNVVGIKLTPHDLRRHAATFASRSGVPIEIVSKIILRHSNLATTQRYLGKVSDSEAMRWIESLYN